MAKTYYEMLGMYLENFIEYADKQISNGRVEEIFKQKRSDKKMGPEMEKQERAGLTNIEERELWEKDQKRAIKEMNERHEKEFREEFKKDCEELNIKVGKTRNPGFLGLLHRMREIHDAKSHDYAEEGNPYKNFNECEDLGISPWKGIVVRLTDKFCRLKGFCKKGILEVVDESIEDTLLDMANYCLLAILVRREEKQNTRRIAIYPEYGGRKKP